MKNLPTFPITAIITVCCLLSCSKEEDLVIPDSADISSLKSTSHHGGAVFTVSPSGNYNDDAEAIQTALEDAVTAGPGSTVQLTKGTFYLKDRIEIEGFDGFFKGAGKNKTIITTHGMVNIDDVTLGDSPALFKFRHGKINISDMSIRISDPEPTNGADYLNTLPNVFMITGNSVENIGATDQAASSTFNNVNFVGGVGNIEGYNVIEFILIAWEGWPPEPYGYSLNGHHKITNCEFQTALWCIWSDFINGPFIIGGDESSGNIFNNTDVGVILYDLNNSLCNISHNRFTKISWNAIELGQGLLFSDLTLSKYLIHGNDIEVISHDPELDFTNAIRLVDYGIAFETYIDTKMDITVSSNKIYLNNVGWGGISGSYTKNVVVKNNKIWGNGMAGIYCGISDDPCSDWVIKGNNVQGVNAQVAPIWLGPATSNCIVYADKKDVLDEGTNNILIGDHKKRCDHPSLEMKEKMMRQHDMMKSHKRPGMMR